MTRLFLALALIAAPVAAAEPLPEWRYVNTDDTGSHYYLRTEDWLEGRSHMRSAKAWLMTDSSGDKTIEWKSSKMLVSVDCVAETYRSLWFVFTYPSGKVESHAASDKSVRPVVPGTILAGAVDMLCVDPAPTPEEMA